MKKLRTLSGLGLLIILIITIILLALPIYSSAYGSKSANLKSPSLLEWKIYKNEKVDFSIKYPPDWYILEIPSGGVAEGVELSTHPLGEIIGSKVVDTQGFFKMNIVALVEEPIIIDQSLEEWVKTRWNYDPSIIRSEELSTVAEQKAVVLKIENYPGIVNTSIFLFLPNSTYGTIAINIGASPFTQPEMEEIFQQIIGTIEIN
jgi:hypothetical protein